MPSSRGCVIEGEGPFQHSRISNHLERKKYKLHGAYFSPLPWYSVCSSCMSEARMEAQQVKINGKTFAKSAA